MNQSPTTFPYPLPELDLSAPFEQYEARVIPDWVDGNGHMNMAYYMVAFDKASDVMLEQLGLSWPYTEHKLGMLFVLEAHIHYEQELREGEPIRVASQIVDWNRKLMHLFHTMLHGERRYTVATCEVMMLHVDYQSRKSVPWPEACIERLTAMADAHRSLARPGGERKPMGIRKSRE